MTEAMPLVAIDRLSKHYGQFIALDELGLQVNPGEVVALLGPNGAGKTTTIKLLMGMLAPTSGVARIGGYECFTQRADVMRFVGYQPDEPVYQDHLTGWDLIRFSGDMRGMSPQQIHKAAFALTDRFDLTKDLNEYANNYSKGMKKKLAAVMAMMHEPAVLLLDEPTNGLDPYATRDFLALMNERAAAGTAIFFCTHLLEQAEKCCRRVGIIHKGRLAMQGAIDELTNHGEQSLEQLFFAATGGEGQTVHQEAQPVAASKAIALTAQDVGDGSSESVGGQSSFLSSYEQEDCV